MTKRVSPIERVRAEIDQLFSSDQDLGDVLEQVARLGLRLLLQSALDAEITEFLGRERYQRGEQRRTPQVEFATRRTRRDLLAPVAVKHSGQAFTDVGSPTNEQGWS